MNQNQVQSEDEIDLREIIQTIVKRKKIVLITFFVFIIIATISVLRVPEVYEGKALIRILPARTFSPKEVAFDIVSNADGGYSLSQYRVEQRSTLSMKTHEMVLKSSEVIGAIFLKVKQKKIIKSDITQADFFGSFDVEIKQEDNVLELKAKNEDPEKAAEMANLWAKEYIKYNTQFVLNEVKERLDFICEQFSQAKEKLLKSEKEINDFNCKYNIEIFDKDKSFKQAKAIGFKEAFINAEYAFKEKQKQLKVLEEEIKKHKKFIVVSKAITDDALWQSEINGTDDSQRNSKSLRQEIVNPIYQDLEKRIAETIIGVNNLAHRIESLKKAQKINEEAYLKLKKETVKLYQEKLILERKRLIEQNLYNVLLSRMGEVRVAKVLRSGDVRLLSAAIVSKTPVGIAKGTVIMLAGISGLMTGIFVAFFREFLGKGKDRGKGEKKFGKK